MKILIIALTICAKVGLVEAQTTVVASDNFNRANGPIGANWTDTLAAGGSFIITNDVVTVDTEEQHIEAFWSANSFSDDQYSQISLSSIGPWTGVILRGDAGLDPVWTNPPSGSQFYLGFVFGPNDYRIYHWINNAYYQETVGTTETWQVGDTLRLAVSGSVEPLVTMYRNGNPVLLWLVTDAADVKTSGSPGIGIYSRAGAGLTLDNWEGGNLNPDTNAPSVPGNLAASAVGPNQINLSWLSSTDDVGVVGYEVERSQGAGSTNFFLLDLSVGTNYVDANGTTRYTMYTTNSALLVPGATYNYVVMALDAAGNLSGSNMVTATTPIPPLPVISAIPDQTTLAGISVGPFPFFISDPGVDPSLLTAFATSSNTNLVPAGNLTVFNINGTSQALTIIPVDGQSGTSTITVTASNGVNSTNTTFLLTVNPPGGGTDVFAQHEHGCDPIFWCGCAVPSDDQCYRGGGDDHERDGDPAWDEPLKSRRCECAAGRTGRADCGAHVRHGGEQSHDGSYVYAFGPGVLSAPAVFVSLAGRHLSAHRFCPEPHEPGICVLTASTDSAVRHNLGNV